MSTTGTYNIARKAAIKKAEIGGTLDSEVTDGEKGRGKRQSIPRRHFDDDSASEEDHEDNVILHRDQKNKKKKQTNLSSDSDDGTESLPPPKITGVKERIKVIHTSNTSSGLKVSISKSTSSGPHKMPINKSTSSGPHKMSINKSTSSLDDIGDDVGFLQSLKCKRCLCT